MTSPWLQSCVLRGARTYEDLCDICRHLHDLYNTALVPLGFDVSGCCYFSPTPDKKYTFIYLQITKLVHMLKYKKETFLLYSQHSIWIPEVLW